MKALAGATMLVAVWVASATTAVAEEKVHFGFLGGPNFASATIHPTQSYDLATRNRVNAGGFVELGLTRVVSLQARGMYVQKGVGAQFAGGDITTAKASVDFLSFPMLIKAKADRASWEPYVIAGPEIGFKLNADAVFRALGRETKDQNFNEGVDSMEVGLSFGGGVEVPAGRVHLFAEGVYSLGLTNLVKIPGGNVTSAKTRPSSSTSVSASDPAPIPPGPRPGSRPRSRSSLFPSPLSARPISAHPPIKHFLPAVSVNVLSQSPCRILLGTVLRSAWFIHALQGSRNRFTKHRQRADPTVPVLPLLFRLD